MSQSVFNGASAGFVEHLDGKAVAWRRSRARAGGDLDGSFSLAGPLDELVQRFYGWLGYDVREDTPGDNPWCGYVQGLTLHYGGKSRRRSLDDVRNALRAKYKWMIDNGEFEYAGSGTTFASWSEVTTGGTVNDEIVNYAQYEHAVRLTYVTSATCYIYQDIAVVPRRMYTLGFLTRGDGTVDGRYQIYDITNAANIVTSTSTGVTAATYTIRTVNFMTPAGCVSIRLYLRAPVAAGSGYFDAVWLKRYEEDKEMPEVTDWVTNDESIARYGRRELVNNQEAATQATAEAWIADALVDGAWPAVSDPSYNGDEARLDVDVVGYWATAAMRYHTQDVVGNQDAGSVIGDIIANDCDWLTELTVPTIGTEGQVRSEDYITARAAIDKLLPAHYRLRVDAQRRVLVEAIDTAALYWMQGGQLYETPGTARPVDPYSVLAGVAVQDMDWAELAGYESGRTSGATTFILNEFDVDESGTLIPRG